MNEEMNIQRLTQQHHNAEIEITDEKNQSKNPGKVHDKLKKPIGHTLRIKIGVAIGLRSNDNSKRHLLNRKLEHQPQAQHQAEMAALQDVNAVLKLKKHSEG